uniref:Uncharacterized protein n=1 Tax=Rhizophora mucronata TaxID=61149 RepID=A0A2P2Q0Z7_RHIMU
MVLAFLNRISFLDLDLSRYFPCFLSGNLLICDSCFHIICGFQYYTSCS